MNNTTRLSESALRARYQRQGLRVVKIRENSRDYWQYGPYMLVDSNRNFVVASGLDLDGLREQVDK